jgi:hypothetical protein
LVKGIKRKALSGYRISSADRLYREAQPLFTLYGSNKQTVSKHSAAE